MRQSDHVVNSGDSPDVPTDGESQRPEGDAQREREQSQTEALRLWLEAASSGERDWNGLAALAAVLEDLRGYLAKGYDTLNALLEKPTSVYNLETCLVGVETDLALALRNWRELMAWLRSRNLWEDDKLFEQLGDPNS